MKKGAIFIIIFLLLAIIGLCYYIAIDKLVLSNEEDDDEVTTSRKVDKDEEKSSKKEEKIEKKDEEETKTEVSKSYADIKGTYESQKFNLNEGSDLEPYTAWYKLIISEDGTFAYYDLDTDCHYLGYYTIVKDKLTLHSVVATGNDPSASLSNEVSTLTIKDDGTIVDSDRKMSSESVFKGELKFTRTSETPREDTNIAKTIDKYLAGCTTSGKDGNGPWFSGLGE